MNTYNSRKRELTKFVLGFFELFTIPKRFSEKEAHAYIDLAVESLIKVWPVQGSFPDQCEQFRVAVASKHDTAGWPLIKTMVDAARGLSASKSLDFRVEDKADVYENIRREQLRKWYAGEMDVPGGIITASRLAAIGVRGRDAEDVLRFVANRPTAMGGVPQDRSVSND